ASRAGPRSLRKLGCVLANPDSITTAGAHGFRLSPLSRLGRNDRLKDLASNNTSSFPRRIFAPGVCTFASLTRKEGWAERRETFGCQRAPVGRAVSRHARRLRGALRPMTQQYTGRNNVTISMPGGGSVPIVSQTEIDPMKIALSLMLALATTTALAEPLPVPQPPGPGGSCSHGYIASRSFCAPSQGAADGTARGDGSGAAATACGA